MQRLLEKIREILRNRRIRMFFTRFVSLAAAIVVFITTYALVLPAITLEKTASCGIDEHQHDESCYEYVLTCGQEESEGHHHDDSCYTVTEELECEIEEHQHSEDNGCYDEEGNLICQLAEHTHDDSCYSEKKTLTCDQQESEGHQHTDACYEKVLVCDKEVHIHSAECYKDEENAEAADQSSSVSMPEESAGEAETEAASEEILPETNVPELDPLNIEAVFGKDTGFYYFHAEEGQEVPANSAEILDWHKVEEDTELAPTDLVKMYLPYTIPAGSLNETNPTARYRLPENIHLTDDQIKAINKNENGITALYAETDPEYQMYLGIEAIEGDRTPDQLLQDGVQEYISAVVRAENKYENNQYIGQDLIFTFVPYTIEKNQIIYGKDDNPVSAGEMITGWFACDFNLSQIDWVEEEKSEDEDIRVEEEIPAGDEIRAEEENPADEDIQTEKDQDTEPDDTESGDTARGESEEEVTANDEVITVEKTADILFVSENREENIQEIRRTLRLVEEKEISVSEEEETDAETPEFRSGTLSVDGDGYRITMDYTKEAKIPENASLSVREITAETDKEAYEACLAQAQEHVDESGEKKSSVDSNASRFFDIEILAPDNGRPLQKIEPAAPVSVNIQIVETPVSDSGSEESQKSAPTVLHFAEDGVEKIESTISTDEAAEDKKADSDASYDAETNTDSDKASNNVSESAETMEIRFDAESFSIYGVVYTVDFHWEVDGKVFEFSIHGGETVSLKTVLSALNVLHGEKDNDIDEEIKDNDSNEEIAEALHKDLEEFIEDIDSVTFTNQDLLRVVQITGNTTAAALKEALGVVVEASAEITEEKLAEYDAREFTAPDWALISLKAFDSEETLTITMKDGQVITILVTDLNENPLGLGGKSFKIVNNSRAITNTVNGTSTTYGQRFDSNATLSNGETWTFEYTGNGTQFLLKDSQGRYLLMIPRAVANSTPGLVQGLQITTDRELAERYPIVAREMIDSNGKRGYCLMDTSSTYALAIDSSNRFYLDTAVFANNKTDPKYCMELRDPSTTGQPGLVNTADTRADGIKINLFDYYSLVTGSYFDYYTMSWVNYVYDNLDEANNEWPNAYNSGINYDHALKFTSHGTGPSSVDNVSINNWANPSLSDGKYVSIQGVVDAALDSNGYPVLSTNGESLDYLFNEDDIDNAKTAYTDLNHLFIKDERGYYRYDSNENYAYYNAAQGDDGNFAIYAGTFNEEGSDNTKNEAVGFFPFNDYDASHTCIHGDGNAFYNYTGHNGSQTPGWYDHQFGMSLEASFVMTPDGKYLGDDIVFNFSGDDDLWVFVDGVLVLDIGGIHNPVAGEINFNTGAVTVSDEVHGGTPDQLVVKGSDPGPKSIKEAFERVSGKNWDDSPYSRHKMQVFYMERGGMYSNLKISFNLPTYKTITVEKKLEGLNEKQLEKYNDEYFYYQVNVTDPQHPDTPIPYTGPYGVLTRPATQDELNDWVPETEVINGEEVYIGGHWRENSNHLDTETINKNGELVRWHIQVNDGIVRVKPGWYFTIEELAQGEKFSVAELYGYPPTGHAFYDGEEDDSQPDPDLMEPFFAPTAEYTYYNPEDVFHKEALPLNEEENVDGRKAWRSGTKELKYSDWVHFINTLPTALDVEKVWTDRNGDVVTHTEDPINYKIYRIPYQMADDPENEGQKIRVDYPVEELVKTAAEQGAGKVYIPSMEGYTGVLKYDGDNPDQSWKEMVTWLPRVGKLIPAGETDPIEVLYEYYVTEETHVDGYKHFIEGGEITDADNPNYANYSYVIKNVPMSPTDQQTRIDIEKTWGDDELHKNDSIVFGITQKKYKAEATYMDNGTPVKRKLYPITINLVDEGGHAGNPRETDTRVVYVPEHASFTLTPYYNDPTRPDNHVVSVGGNDIVAGTTTGATPRTRSIITSNGAPSSTYYYPNDPSQLIFTIQDVDEAKEVTLWLYAGDDEWVKLYDVDHPTVNYLDKTVPGGDSMYHKWTCELSSDRGIIWDIDEVLDNIVPGHGNNADPNNPSEPVETKLYEYTMRLTSNSDSGLPTVFSNGVGAPGYAEGDDENTWKGSITDLPLYEYEGDQNLPYIYTYEVIEAKIGSETVNVSPVYGTETPPVLYNGQTSHYLVQWELDDEDGSWKFMNKAKETIEVSALKKWVDSNGDPMAPPNGAVVTFELYADGVATGKAVVLNGTTVAAQIAAIDADTEMTDEEKAEAKAVLQALTFGELATAWKADWKDLPKYNYAVISEIPEESPSETPNVPIVYTVKETVTYQGYENMNPDGVGNNGEITNKQLTFSLKIVKVDAIDTETGLSGAKFQLTRRLPGEGSFTKFEHDSFEVEEENDNKKTGPFTVDSTEGIILEGLIPGEYKIEEKTAPDGYIITLQPYIFTLTANGEVTSSNLDDPLVVPLLKNGDDPAGLQIGNTPGAALPNTGGLGTNLIYLLGVVLICIAGAGLHLFRKGKL